jgi:hypothetical protein
MILLEILRQRAKINCRQCHRDQCATGQTLPANPILSVHKLSLFVDMRVETFSPVVQYALRNVLKQMQIVHQYQGRRGKIALFLYEKIKSFGQCTVRKK